MQYIVNVIIVIVIQPLFIFEARKSFSDNSLIFQKKANNTNYYKTVIVSHSINISQILNIKSFKNTRLTPSTVTAKQKTSNKSIANKIMAFRQTAPALFKALKKRKKKEKKIYPSSVCKHWQQSQSRDSPSLPSSPLSCQQTPSFKPLQQDKETHYTLQLFIN